MTAMIGCQLGIEFLRTRLVTPGFLVFTSALVDSVAIDNVVLIHMAMIAIAGISLR